MKEKLEVKKQGNKNAAKTTASLSQIWVLYRTTGKIKTQQKINKTSRTETNNNIVRSVSTTSLT